MFTQRIEKIFLVHVELYPILLPVKCIADQEMTNCNNVAFIYVWMFFTNNYIVLLRFKSNTDVETSFHFAYILQFLQCLLYFKTNAHKSTLVNHFIIFDADFTPNI